MSVTFFHGEGVSESYQAFQDALTQARRQGLEIIKLDGKELTLAQLNQSLGQDDFFGTPRAITLQNLLARPKSKAREEIIAHLLTLPCSIWWWEGKKITPVSLKPLVASKVQIQVFAEKDLIWGLLARWRPAPTLPADFASYFTNTWNQIQQKNKTGAGIYLLGMFIWHTQQLLEIKENTFAGAPFQLARLQNQAQNFSHSQLVFYHQHLIDLDYRAKSGRLQLDLEKHLLLLLLTPPRP